MEPYSDNAKLEIQRSTYRSLMSYMDRILTQRLQHSVQATYLFDVDSDGKTDNELFAKLKNVVDYRLKEMSLSHNYTLKPILEKIAKLSHGDVGALETLYHELLEFGKNEGVLHLHYVNRYDLLHDRVENIKKGYATYRALFI